MWTYQEKTDTDRTVVTALSVLWQTIYGSARWDGVYDHVEQELDTVFI